MNCEQKSSKKVKQNKTEDKRPQTNLDNWLKKMPKNNLKSNDKSDYFKNKRYSDISDTELDVDLNQYKDINQSDLKSDDNSFKSQTQFDDNQMEDVFDEEFDKLFDEKFGNNFNGLISEDFQKFEDKSNDLMEGMMTSNTQNSVDSVNTQFSEFSLKNQWSLFLPTTQLEGKTFFTEN